MTETTLPSLKIKIRFDSDQRFSIKIILKTPQFLRKNITKGFSRLMKFFIIRNLFQFSSEKYS